MTIENSFNFRRISDSMSTSGFVTEEALGGLAAAGYQLVINLMPDDSEYAVSGEASIVANQGAGYVYLPVDFASPTEADFEAFASALDANPGLTVHVHCAANYRVSAFYSLYAMRKGLWSTEEADEHLKGIWTQEFPVWDAFIAEQRSRMNR